MYKNNTVNIQNGTPDTEYIDEFLFFFPRGDGGGLLRALYIVPIYTDTHGFQIGVCLWGLRAGAALGILLSEDPFPALPRGLGPGLGDSPSVAGKTNNPSLGTAPSGGNYGGGHSPRPTPSPSPCSQSGMVGEVANRFPGQHRGRLGWSSGQRGVGGVGAQVLPIPPPLRFNPALLGAQPSTAPFGPAGLLACLVPPPEGWAALVAAASLCSVMPRVQLEVRAGHPG